MAITKKEKILNLIDSCKALGWDMVIPNVDNLKDDDEIPGMVIGSEAYISLVMEYLPEYIPEDEPSKTLH